MGEENKIAQLMTCVNWPNLVWTQDFFIFCDSVMIGSVSHSKVHLVTAVAMRQLVLTWQRGAHVPVSTNEKAGITEIDQSEAWKLSEG